MSIHFILAPMKHDFKTYALRAKGMITDLQVHLNLETNALRGMLSHVCDFLKCPVLGFFLHWQHLPPRISHVSCNMESNQLIELAFEMTARHTDWPLPKR